MWDLLIFKLHLFIYGEPLEEMDSFQGSRRVPGPWLGGCYTSKGHPSLEGCLVIRRALGEVIPGGMGREAISK